jgi:hypothetical protein
MAQLEATTYEAVRDKFLEELQAKKPPGPAKGKRKRRAGQRERGAGIWNSAFSQSGRMERSSIVLLAEFFQVEPQSLILDSRPPPESAQVAPPGEPPSLPEALSIHVEGQHHQVIASTGGIVIQGSIVHTVATPSPSEPG